MIRFARAAEGRGDYIFTDVEKIGNVAVLEDGLPLRRD